jgi:hypothetical protein
MYNESVVRFTFVLSYSYLILEGISIDLRGKLVIMLDFKESL